jgi:hypothetical protein
MVDSVRYYGGAQNIDKFLESLRWNLDSHKHPVLKGDADWVKHAISHLVTWNNNTDASRRHSANTDPSEWVSDLRDEVHTWVQDFELFTQELMKMYGDKDRGLNAAMKAMEEFQPLSNESVRVYAHRIKANWGRGGWYLVMHDVVLNDMAWLELGNAMITKVTPWITKYKDSFETLDKLLD